MLRRHRTVGLVVVLALSVAGLGATSEASGPDGPIELQVTGVLESIAREPGPGLHTSLLLDDGSRLEVARTASMPPSGRVSATVTVAGSRSPSLAGRSLDATSDEAQPLLDVIRAEPVRLREAAYDVEPAATAPARHRLHLAIPTNLGDFGAMNDAALVDLLSDAGDYWVTESDGVVSGVDVGEPRRFVSTVGASNAGCGLADSAATQQVWDEADDLFPGVDFTAGPDHLVVVLPDECQLWGALGMGTVGRSLASGGKVLVHAEPDSRLGTLVHELGHNVSLHHARARSCWSAQPTSCSSYEYGDLYDPMGYGIGAPTALNSAHRDVLGLMDAGEAQTVALADGATTLTLSARLVPRSASDGRRTLAVVDPQTLDRYYVDYRSGTGRDAGAVYDSGYRLNNTVSYGAGVVVTAGADDRGSMLWTRFVASDQNVAAWQPGQVFQNLSGSVSVRVDAVAPGQYADVTVTVQTGWTSFVDPPTPFISGTPEVGETLRVDPGTWPAGTNLDVRWLVDGYEVATGDDSYALFLYSNWRHREVSVEVRAAKEGVRTVHRSSVAVGPVTRPAWGSVRIQSSSVPRVGTPVTSTISTSPTSAERDLQWLIGGVPVPGATDTTYTPVPSDAGAMLSLRMSLRASGFDPAVVQSNELGPVLALAPTTSPTPTATATPTTAPTSPVPTGSPEPEEVVLGTLKAPRPTIVGKPRVGRRLTAQPGRWTSGTTLRFKWLANRKVIRGATRSTYVPTRAVRGKRLTVRVVGTKRGYAPATVTSPRTSPVR